MSFLCPYESDYMHSDDFKFLLDSAKKCQLVSAKEHMNKLNKLQNELIKEMTLKENVKPSYNQDLREYAGK